MNERLFGDDPGTRGYEAAGRTPRPRRAVAVLAVLAATALLASGCGGRNTAAQVHNRVLTATDLPAGWSVVPTSPNSVKVADAPCFTSLPKNPKGWTYSVAGFVEGTSIPSITEVLAAGPQVRQAWQRLDRALARCRTFTGAIGGKKFVGTVRPLSFPRVGSTSSAYLWAFRLVGVKLGVDFVVFRAGAYEGYLTYSDLGRPDVATVKAYADAAVAKATKGSTVRVADSVSIASAPVQTVHTTLGTVAYRSVGSGPPLVLITGYSGTMEGWDRRFLDALARRYRVVIFDNAGVGQTGALPAPLKIDAMANQTSALIGALGLRRANVLGWSMGSMIAQALAVLHPAQVRRLVLCASFPGDGTSVRPSQAAIDALKSGNSQQVMADLFPADQTAAQNTYLAAISAYPPAPPAPAATVAAQSPAVDGWWAGTDPAGTKTSGIAVPTLVADGTVDRLDPVANSHTLAKLIPRAKLTLYPDAGHAFLFQDQSAFVPLIESFLG
ncbi:MAG TPA: alpha/beta hydrolase [Gaiellaceae bacterium]